MGSVHPGPSGGTGCSMSDFEWLPSLDRDESTTWPSVAAPFGRSPSCCLLKAAMMVCLVDPVDASAVGRFWGNLSPSVPEPLGVGLGFRPPWVSWRRGPHNHTIRFRVGPHSDKWPSAWVVRSSKHHSHVFSLWFSWKYCHISISTWMACLGSRCSARGWWAKSCSAEGPPRVKILPQMRHLVRSALQKESSSSNLWNSRSLKQSQTCRMELMGTWKLIESRTASVYSIGTYNQSPLWKCSIAICMKGRQTWACWSFFTIGLQIQPCAGWNISFSKWHSRSACCVSSPWRTYIWFAVCFTIL